MTKAKTRFLNPRVAEFFKFIAKFWKNLVTSLEIGGSEEWQKIG